MVLRKHLEKARIRAIRQKGWERILEIDFSGHNDWGDENFYRLVIEIMGKHSNIILLNQDGLILDGIRRYSHVVSRHREVLPGRTYIAPPEQNKADLSSYDEEKLAELFFALPYDMKIMDALLKEAAGFSPLIVEEALERASLAKSITVEELGAYEMSRLHRAINELYAAFSTKAFAPVLLGGDNPRDIAAFPLVVWQNEIQKSYISPSAALDDFYQLKGQNELFSSRQRDLIKLVDGHYQRLEKKLALQRKDLDKALKSEYYKEAADILSANLYNLQKGQEKAELENFYRPGETLVIELNPALTPEENMRLYYRRYTKGKNALVLINNQLKVNQEEFDYIDTLLVNLHNAVMNEELDEIKEELETAGYLKAKRPVKNKKLNKAAPLPPRSFISSDGYAILVGRNNRQNDILTLRIANKNDIWLHTQKIPGSHVIVRNIDGKVTDTALVEAASLAAWYSKAQAADKVAVDYTTVDQVKKPNGAKPGMVIYFQQKTLYVKPKEQQQKDRAD